VANKTWSMLMLLPLLVGCATLMRLAGTSGGAAVGSLAGPGGAAVGAAVGLLAVEATSPSAEELPPPDTVWGLLSELIDKAGWLAFLIALLWLLTWIAPSPKELLKRWRGKEKK